MQQFCCPFPSKDRNHKWCRYKHYIVPKNPLIIIIEGKDISITECAVNKCKYHIKNLRFNKTTNGQTVGPNVAADRADRAAADAQVATGVTGAR